MKAIFNRKSIRKYKDTKINDEIIEELLKAGMAGRISICRKGSSIKRAS